MRPLFFMHVLYEDNHIIIVNKAPGEIVQGDKTGDTPLSEQVKLYIKEKYQKPGNVFLGVVHRLDRPVSGVVVFARTGKALARLNEMFRTGSVKKTYHAIVANTPQQEAATLEHWLTRNERLPSAPSTATRNTARPAPTPTAVFACTPATFASSTPFRTSQSTSPPLTQRG